MNAAKSLLTGLVLSFALAGSALAAGVEINATPTGLALQGYDPVAYFTDGKPMKGSVDISATYEDATYRFTSEEHKATFEADPAAYAPQYGGYCAFGAAMGFKFDGDPEQWRIVDDKLYLNLSSAVQERWVEDIPGNISMANEKWMAIVDKTPAELQAASQ